MSLLSGKLTGYDIMFLMERPQFKDLFKKFRLKSGFATLGEFGKALAEEGLIYEDSLLSRWQKGSRIPKERQILIALIKIFIEKEGITAIKGANNLLESAGQGYLTEKELIEISKSPTLNRPVLSPLDLLNFTLKIGKSKKILRSGWVREKVKDPESVAEHSFRLSVITMIISEQLGLDKEKLIQMAILHDLGELVTGDLVWSRGKVIDIKKRSKKEEMEKNGIKKIFDLIGMDKQYTNLYEEMIERRTEEAKFFWQIDKLEMAIQALEYEKSDNKNLEEFFINADLQIHSPYLKKIMKEVFRQRKGKRK